MGWAKIANIKGPKGDPGPQAVSANAGNQARLGTDHLIFVPAVTGFLTQTAADARYALTSALSAYIKTVDADAKYALKTAIPSLAAYITTAAADAKYALKTQLPNMALYLLKTEAATLYEPKVKIYPTNGAATSAAHSLPDETIVMVVP